MARSPDTFEVHLHHSSQPRWNSIALRVPRWKLVDFGGVRCGSRRMDAVDAQGDFRVGGVGDRGVWPPSQQLGWLSRIQHEARESARRDRLFGEFILRTSAL